MNKGLIIFAREPLPGRVKTRMASDVGHISATDLYAAMLADVLDMADSLKNIKPMLFWATDNNSLPALQIPPHFEQFLQSGKGLGERMANALATAFSRGIKVCCLIGSDSPDLPEAYILKAFELLEQNSTDLVLGPCADGGYYLTGMKCLRRELFEGIIWGSGSVLEESLQKAKQIEMRTSLLPEWYDIDNVDDLRRLITSSSNSASRTRTAAASILGESTR